MYPQSESRQLLMKLLKDRILILDGGMGTIIQTHQLSEADYRGERYVDIHASLKGNHDVLCLTRPDVIVSVHQAYLDAGADIIETCTFSANAVSQAEYGLQNDVTEINLAAVRAAKQAVERCCVSRPVFIAGSVGPTRVSLSMQSDDKTRVSFDQLCSAYAEQIEALVIGGVDFILVETIFDVLNAKAANVAALRVQQKLARDVPVAFSVTLADSQGRLLSGQTLEAFWATIEPLDPLSVTLNCGFGVTELMKFLPSLSAMASVPIGCYPNAGLPDEEGTYHDTGCFMAEKLVECAQNQWLNLVGGCCGTTPDHIRHLAERLKTLAPRPFADVRSKGTQFAGLEVCKQSDQKRIVIAERANVTGSKKFKRLIETGAWEEALDVARDQMRAGADMIDICMDAPMLDAVSAMTVFLRKIAAEPEIARYPLVIDSSNFEVIASALKEVAGRCLVNSISLKGGVQEFVKHAQCIHDFGAAVVVMAFDEQGQASTTQDRIRILSRAVDILTQQVGFELKDIVVDPNILAIGTGLPEHDIQAVSFIESCRELKKRYPGLQTSGGLSNLSFSFRGRDDIREAIHAAFLKAAGSALTMVIANPVLTRAPEEIDPELFNLAQALVEAKPGALEALLGWADQHAPAAKQIAPLDALDSMAPQQRLTYAMTRGVTRYLQRDILALTETLSPLQIIEGPLMDAMNVVGEKFGRGEMFLPQIVKAAKVMKQAIGYLDLSAQTASELQPKRVLMATVWGDVHDIGKNIVDIVLTCNGFEVIDLGVMVPTEKIVSEAIRLNVDAIGLSGLISPSLKVMQEVAQALKKAGVRVPLFVGGAATSDAFAAIKLAPAYAPGIVTHITDASRVPGVLAPWLNPDSKQSSIDAIQSHHAEIVQASGADFKLLSIDAARELRPVHTYPQNVALESATRQKQKFTWSALELESKMVWTPICKALRVRDVTDPEAIQALDRKIKMDVHAVFEAAALHHCLETHAYFQLVLALAHDETITVFPESDVPFEFTVPRVLKADKPHHALSDYLPPQRRYPIGLFALTSSLPDALVPALARYTNLDPDYTKLISELAMTSLVSAANDVMHENLSTHFGNLIRPAVGYPMIPDHNIKRPLLSALHAENIGISLTPNAMMLPSASICGFTIFHQDAVYYDPS